jgi:hypothetical protein
MIFFYLLTSTFTLLLKPELCADDIFLTLGGSDLCSNIAFFPQLKTTWCALVWLRSFLLLPWYYKLIVNK